MLAKSITRVLIIATFLLVLAHVGKFVIDSRSFFHEECRSGGNCSSPLHSTNIAVGTAPLPSGNSTEDLSPAEEVSERQPSSVAPLSSPVVSGKHAAVTFAWEIHDALQSMNFSKGAERLDIVVGKKHAATDCSLRDKLLTKRVYRHRNKRKGELENMELYWKVKNESQDIVEFAPRLPSAVGQFPIAFLSKFNLTRPFGSWKTAFVSESEALRAKSPQLVHEQPPLFVAVFRPGFLHLGNIVTCDGKLYTTGGCLWEAYLPQRLEHSAKEHKVLIGVPLCDSWCRGYYHFTHEHLPRLSVVHQMLLNNPDAHLVLSHAPNSFQRQYFDILGIPRKKILHTPVFAEQVVYPMPLRCGNTFTHMLHFMRNVVTKSLHLQPTISRVSKKFHMLFAERGKLSRMPSNYYALKELLAKDFEQELAFNTTSGRDSIATQIGMFYHADVVLGPHGANLANMMWMRPGTHVIEIMSWSSGNMCYYSTASRINVTHHLMMHGSGKDGKYTLEYEDLKRHVHYALGALSRASVHFPT